MGRTLVAASLLAVALLAGCQSKEEKLIELRSELRGDLDALYARYGGGSLAKQAKADAERSGSAEEGSGTAGRLFGELDRSYFETYCLAHGRGERPFNLSGKLDAFMKDPANQEVCRDAAKLETRIRELEARPAR
jgi:outer membrane murein-binding lipoprotein Lpp